MTLTAGLWSMDLFSIAYRSGRLFGARCGVRIEKGRIQRLGPLQCDLHRKPPVGSQDGLLPQTLAQLRLAGGSFDRGGKRSQAGGIKHESVFVMRDQLRN